MTEFELKVLEQIANLRERLMGIETQLKTLPCLNNCPRPSQKNNSWKKWAALGLGIGVGLGGGGSALLQLLGG